MSTIDQARGSGQTASLDDFQLICWSFVSAPLGTDEDFWVEQVRPKSPPPDPAEADKDAAYVTMKLWDAVRGSQEENSATSPKETTA